MPTLLATFLLTAALAADRVRCDDFTQLEPQAVSGKLTPEVIECLERHYAMPDERQKDKISRTLIANAYAAGNDPEWARLVQRHLDEVDNTDADLLYKWVLYLYRPDIKDWHGALAWSDKVLEHQAEWTGDVLKQRLTGLYKVRTGARWKLVLDAQAACDTPAEDAQSALDAAYEAYLAEHKNWSTANAASSTVPVPAPNHKPACGS
jgi:hypothetical protein